MSARYRQLSSVAQIAGPTTGLIEAAVVADVDRGTEMLNRQDMAQLARYGEMWQPASLGAEGPYWAAADETAEVLATEANDHPRQVAARRRANRAVWRHRDFVHPLRIPDDPDGGRVTRGPLWRPWG